MFEKPNKIYYKIQIFDKNSLSYIDRQVAYKTIDEAIAKQPKKETSRIMVVDGKKRYVLG